MQTPRPRRGFWLWLLTLGLGLGPLIGIVATYETLQQTVLLTPDLATLGPWQSYVIFTCLMSLGILAACWYGIHLIVNGQHRGHIHRLIIILWCFGPGVRILDIVAAGILFGVEQFSVALTSPDVLVPIGANAILAFIWTLYLSSSERVAERYPVRPDAAAISR